jgi:hypothetical protein
MRELSRHPPDLLAEALIAGKSADSAADRTCELAEDAADGALRPELRPGREGQEMRKLARDPTELLAQALISGEPADGAARGSRELTENAADGALRRELLS